jgi:hypothetical protein
VCGCALYALGKPRRPVAATVGVALTLAGTIYLGGVFGMWLAFKRGLGDIDPQLLTTVLSKLAIIGLAVQIAVLARTGVAPIWAVIASTVGCVVILVFWDVDNLMLVGAAAMLAGFIPISRSLRSGESAITSG